MIKQETKRVGLTILVGICLGAAAMAAGCVQKQVQTAAAVPDCPPCSTETADRLATENQKLKTANQTLKTDLNSGHARIAELERLVADLEIRKLQSEALIIDMQRRSFARQKQLDSAITDVVRTKSKLRSIESKAEAASTIAEAEIAVKTMKSRVEDGDPEKTEALEKAEHLLQQSTVEFEAHNYGGALYLAVQSKNQVDTLDPGIQGRDTGARLAGERAFDQPLPLKLIKNTNLRTGPGLSNAIRSTLDSGSVIVGYAYKDDWIRIETEDGQIGWIHQTLVMAR